MSGNDAIISGNYEFNFQNNKILGDWETLLLNGKHGQVMEQFVDG